MEKLNQLDLYIPVYNGCHLEDRAFGRLSATSGRGVRFETVEGERCYGIIDGNDYHRKQKTVLGCLPDGQYYVIIPADALGDALRSAQLNAENEQSTEIWHMPANIRIMNDMKYMVVTLYRAQFTSYGITGQVRVHPGYVHDVTLYVANLENMVTPIESLTTGADLMATRHVTLGDAINSCASADDSITTTINNILDEREKEKHRKEHKFMNKLNLNLNLRCGRAPRDFALSFDGHICFKGKYFAKDAVVDTCGLTFDLDQFLFVIPSATISAGDIVMDVVNNVTKAYHYDGKEFIDLETGVKAEIVPTKVFNMTFYSVVKNLAGNLFGGAANSANPMANMLPFLLLSKDGCGDNSDLLTMMLLSQGGLNLFGGAPATPTTPAAK